MALTSAQILATQMKGIKIAALCKLAGDAVHLATASGAANIRDAGAIILQKWLVDKGASVEPKIIAAVIVNAIDPNMPLDGVSEDDVKKSFEK